MELLSYACAQGGNKVKFDAGKVLDAVISDAQGALVVLGFSHCGSDSIEGWTPFCEALRTHFCDDTRPSILFRGKDEAARLGLADIWIQTLLYTDLGGSTR